MCICTPHHPHLSVPIWTCVYKLDEGSIIITPCARADKNVPYSIAVFELRRDSPTPPKGDQSTRMREGSVPSGFGGLSNNVAYYYVVWSRYVCMYVLWTSFGLCMRPVGLPIATYHVDQVFMASISGIRRKAEIYCPSYTLPVPLT